MQVGEDEDEISDMDEGSMENKAKEEDVPESGYRRRKKKFKNSCKTNKCLIFLIILFGMAISVYFIQNFFSNRKLLNNINMMTKELNATGSAESFFYFAYNSQKQLYSNNVQTILMKDPEVIVKENINHMFELDSEIHEEHSLNVGIHENLYKEVYNDLMMLQPCTKIGMIDVPAHEEVEEAVCEEFAEDTLKEVTYYFI